MRPALAFLRDSPETGLLPPWIGGDDGHLQYLCRRYPTVLEDLFMRGFLPSALRRPFARRLARYEMRDAIGETNVVWDPPIASGCFMLFRTDVLKSLGGFDPRYFLYFEDHDLSLRTRRVAYVPSVRILHYGGGASKKGSTHIKLFLPWRAGPSTASAGSDYERNRPAHRRHRRQRFRLPRGESPLAGALHRGDGPRAARSKAAAR
ncbi:glycosyl transferase family protein [Caballeronia cordobensis]|nr:glycosyl transferase family protein [Burkholderia sp. RPE67]